MQGPSGLLASVVMTIHNKAYLIGRAIDRAALQRLA